MEWCVASLEGQPAYPASASRLRGREAFEKRARFGGRFWSANFVATAPATIGSVSVLDRRRCDGRRANRAVDPQRDAYPDGMRSAACLADRVRACPVSLPDRADPILRSMAIEPCLTFGGLCRTVRVNRVRRGSWGNASGREMRRTLIATRVAALPSDCRSVYVQGLFYRQWHRRDTSTPAGASTTTGHWHGGLRLHRARIRANRRWDRTVFDRQRRFA
jgi:hypothetical protein